MPVVAPLRTSAAIQAHRRRLPARAYRIWPTNEELMIAMDTAAIVKG